MYEIVHMIWDIYDGPRSGIANYDSKPCYFNCWSDPGGGYTERFELARMPDELLKKAKEQWVIYRSWEMEYHTGKVRLETHPGNKGVNPRYDELDDLIKEGISKLHKYRCLFTANFRSLPGQEQLPDGVLRDLEVEWKPYSPENV